MILAFGGESVLTGNREGEDTLRLDHLSVKNRLPLLFTLYRLSDENMARRLR